MASKKYKLGADGYYQTKVWDGTYNANGSKHRVSLRSDKSSRDLERQVAAMKAQIESRNYVRNRPARSCAPVRRGSPRG